MVDNVCTKCKQDVDYTINMITDKTIREITNDWWLSNYEMVHLVGQDYRIVEHWCLRCLFNKIPPMGQREDEYNEYRYRLERGTRGMGAVK